MCNYFDIPPEFDEVIRVILVSPIQCNESDSELKWCSTMANIGYDVISREVIRALGVKADVGQASSARP